MGRKKRNGNGNGEADGHADDGVEQRPEARTIEELSDEDRQALFFDHLRKARPLFEAKKEAARDLKQAKELAEGEGVSWKDIEAAIKADTEEGRAKLIADVQRQQRLAQWLGLPVGASPDLFDDAANGDQAKRAAAEGKRAGMNGDPCKPPAQYAPGSEAYNAWCSGHADGNAALARRTIKPKVDPAIAAAAIGGDTKPTYVEH